MRPYARVTPQSDRSSATRRLDICSIADFKFVQYELHDLLSMVNSDNRNSE